MSILFFKSRSKLEQQMYFQSNSKLVILLDSKKHPYNQWYWFNSDEIREKVKRN